MDDIKESCDLHLSRPLSLPRHNTHTNTHAHNTQHRILLAFILKGSEYKVALPHQDWQSSAFPSLSQAFCILLSAHQSSLTLLLFSCTLLHFTKWTKWHTSQSYTFISFYLSAIFSNIFNKTGASRQIYGTLEDVKDEICFHWHKHQ